MFIPSASAYTNNHEPLLSPTPAHLRLFCSLLLLVLFNLYQQYMPVCAPEQTLNNCQANLIRAFLASVFRTNIVQALKHAVIVAVLF